MSSVLAERAIDLKNKGFKFGEDGILLEMPSPGGPVIIVAGPTIGCGLTAALSSIAAFGDSRDVQSVAGRSKPTKNQPQPPDATSTPKTIFPVSPDSDSGLPGRTADPPQSELGRTNAAAARRRLGAKGKLDTRVHGYLRTQGEESTEPTSPSSADEGPPSKAPCTPARTRTARVPTPPTRNAETTLRPAAPGEETTCKLPLAHAETTLKPAAPDEETTRMPPLAHAETAIKPAMQPLDDETLGLAAMPGFEEDEGDTVDPTLPSFSKAGLSAKELELWAVLHAAEPREKQAVAVAALFDLARDRVLQRMAELERGRPCMTPPIETAATLRWLFASPEFAASTNAATALPLHEAAVRVLAEGADPFVALAEIVLWAREAAAAWGNAALGMPWLSKKGGRFRSPPKGPPGDEVAREKVRATLLGPHGPGARALDAPHPAPELARWWRKHHQLTENDKGSGAALARGRTFGGGS